MYSILLLLHNANRWLVLVALMAVLYLVLESYMGQKGHSRPLQIAYASYSGLFNLQALLGLWLYFSHSPYYAQVWAGGFHWPESSDAWFFGIYHPGLMLIGAVASQFFHTYVKRKVAPEHKVRMTMIGTLVPLLLVLLAMPYDRPMARF